MKAKANSKVRTLAEDTVITGTDFSGQCTRSGIEVMHIKGETTQEANPTPTSPKTLKCFEAEKVVVMGKNVAAFKDGSGTRYKCQANQLKDGTTVIKATGANMYANDVAPAGEAYSTSNNGYLIPIPDSISSIYTKCFDGSLTTVYITFYNASKNSISYTGSNVLSRTVAIPSGAKFISFRIGKDASVTGQTYSDRIMISFEPITDWVPPHYEEIELPEKLVLRSVPDGSTDEYIGDGAIVRRCGTKVLNGSETWENAGEDIYYTSARDMKKLTNYSESILCSRTVAATFQSNVNAESGITGYYTPDSDTQYPDDNWIYLYGFGNTNGTDLRSWLASHLMEVIYPLAAPEIETFDMPILPSWDDTCRAYFVSETPTDIEWRALPVSDNKKKIQELEKRIAQLETAGNAQTENEA